MIEDTEKEGPLAGKDGIPKDEVGLVSLVAAEGKTLELARRGVDCGPISFLSEAPFLNMLFKGWEVASPETYKGAAAASFATTGKSVRLDDLGGEANKDVDVADVNTGARGLSMRDGLRGWGSSSSLFLSGTNIELSSSSASISSSASSSVSRCSTTNPSLMARATPTPLITATSVL